MPRNEIAGREFPRPAYRGGGGVNHLYFLLLIMAVLGLRVKITIDRK